MAKKETLTILIGIAVLALVVLIVLLRGEKETGIITALTEKQEYKTGESLKVKINNGSEEIICFSSCYPYYIEKKRVGWESYHYIECLEENLAEKCIEPKKEKAFELTLPEIEGGIHRLAISACLGCYFQDKFRENQKFYSNQFIIE